MLIHRLRPAGTGAAILCSAWMPVASALAAAASPSVQPGAGVHLPAAVQRRVSVGVLPVTSSIDTEYSDLRVLAGITLDGELSNVATAQLVERARLNTLLDELSLAQQNRADLRVGRMVGAELLIAPSIITVDGEVRLDLKLIETATGKVLDQSTRRLAAAPAPGIVAKKELSAAAREVETAVQGFTKALPQRLAQHASRPAAVDVAVLPIRSDGNVGPDLVLAESLRKQLADHIASNVPAARVLHRDLAEFTLGEAALTAGALVAEPRRSAPATAAILVEGTLTQTLAQGAAIGDATMKLRLTVRRGDRALTIDLARPLKEAEALQRDASAALARDVSQLVDGDQPLPAAIAAGGFDSNRHEALQNLSEAGRYMLPWLDGGRRDDNVIGPALDFCTRAALLAPNDSKPFEAAWRSLMADLPGAAPWDPKLTGGTPRDAHPARLLRQQFIKSFPNHPLWPSAVAAELRDLAPDFSEALPPPQEREAWVALANQFANAVLSHEASLDPAPLAARDRSIITIDPVTTLSAASRALMSAGQFERAWEMTMAACEQIDAAGIQPRGYLFCDAYIARALHLRQFEEAWRAAEYLRANYPSYAAASLLNLGEFSRTPEDELRAGGPLEKWQPLLDDARRLKKTSWLSAELANLRALPPPPIEPLAVANLERYTPPAAAGQAAAPATLLSASSEGLKGADALRPWCLLLQPEPRKLVLWRAGTARLIPLEVQPPSVSADGINAPPPTVAAFDGSLYLLTSGALYRVNLETGKCEPQAKALPASATRGLLGMCVYRDSLFVTGGETSGQQAAKGFIARLDTGAKEWRIWTGPDDAGPVTRLLRAPGENRFYSLHAATKRIEVFDPDATPPANVFGERRSVDRQFEQLAATATDGNFTLRLPLSGRTIYLFDHDTQASTPIYFLPANGSGSDHEPFWNPTVIGDHGPAQNPSPAALPLADLPADVAADPIIAGRFWILDRRGGLTAYEPAHDRAAGPFMVAKAGVAISIAGDGLVVNDGTSAVLVHAEDLRQLADHATWTTSRQTHDRIAEQIHAWAKTLPPAARGVYYHTVRQPELAEAALTELGEQAPAEAIAWRIDRCAAGNRFDLALSLMQPYLDDATRINDPKLEDSILLTLQNAHRWDLLEAFLPKLWQLSPLRGGHIPPQRSITQINFLRSKGPSEATAALTALRAGKLPDVPWDWDENATCRCMARQLRRQAMLATTPTPPAAR